MRSAFHLDVAVWLAVAAWGLARPDPARAAAPGGGNGPFQLTAEEQAFLAEHPAIRVGTMADWPPLNFTDSTGRPAGIGVDLLEEMNRLIGGGLQVVPGAFDENLEKVRTGELDALMDVTPKPDREEYLIFTQPYQDIPHVIVGRRNARYYDSAQALAGRTVALENGFGNVKWFEENFPSVRILLFGSTRDALDAVARSQADAYAGNRAVAMYLIEREMLTNLHLQGRLEKPAVVLAIGVRRDWPVAAGLLDRALRHVLRTEGRAIQAKWFEASHVAASAQGERIFTELLNEHRARLKEERERAVYAFEARGQAIGRIGLPAVREHRRKRLQQEHDARMAALDDMEASVPDLNAVMMVRVSGDVMPGGQVG